MTDDRMVDLGDLFDKKENRELSPEVGRCYYESRCETPCGDIDMTKVREVMDRCPHKNDIIPIVHNTHAEDQTFTFAQITEALVKSINEYFYDNRVAFGMNPLIIRRMTTELCCKFAHHITLPDDKKIEDVLYDTRSRDGLPIRDTISLDDIAFAPPKDDLQPKEDKDNDSV